MTAPASAFLEHVQERESRMEVDAGAEEQAKLQAPDNEAEANKGFAAQQSQIVQTVNPKWSGERISTACEGVGQLECVCESGVRSSARLPGPLSVFGPSTVQGLVECHSQGAGQSEQPYPP